ncbi:MAG: glycerol-3-phosphate acyltransferase [Clostridia bacterium]|nr:glycerol-3-phosphate acyltransferase [Clostridia bacterium]
MTERVLSLVIGYLFGCILTADIVSKIYTGKNASELGGSGNPGMANMTRALGLKAGMITLAGDLLKCVLSGALSYRLFCEAGAIVALYAGLGCTLGHDFPFWRRFRGGKGVATTSMAVALFSFPLGVLANLAGMITVFFTKYLCIGGPVIPAAFAFFMLLCGEYEAAVLSAALTVLSLLKHGPDIAGIKRGETKKTDVLGAIIGKFGGKR